jgi:hypothetical protein
MSVNFFNSAGTDLDSLFYVNNGNAGGIGFINASGQDLGNRYTNASTLGYSVGYKNSAGTDLGYLRGNAVPEFFRTWWVYIHLYYNDLSITVDRGSWRTVGGYCSCGADLGGNGSHTFQIKACIYFGSYAGSAWQEGFLDNATTGSTHEIDGKPKANSEADQVQVFSGGCNASPRRNFLFSARHFGNDDACEYGLRVYLRAFNNYGNTGWVHKDFWFKGN